MGCWGGLSLDKAEKDDAPPDNPFSGLPLSSALDHEASCMREARGLRRNGDELAGC